MIYFVKVTLKRHTCVFERLMMAKENFEISHSKALKFIVKRNPMMIAKSSEKIIFYWKNTHIGLFL